MSNTRMIAGPTISVSLEGIAVTFPTRRHYWEPVMAGPQHSDGRAWYEVQCDSIGEAIATTLKRLARREFNLPGDAADRASEVIVVISNEVK